MDNPDKFFAVLWFGTMATLMILWMIFDMFELYGLAFASGIALIIMFSIMLWVAIKLYFGGKNGK